MPATMQMNDRVMLVPAAQGDGQLVQANGKVAAFNQHSGFTLIELVIAITIVSLIVAIAYPAYLSQVNKSRRSDATTSLMNVVNNQEQYLLDHNQYAADMTLLGYAANPYITPEGMYSVAVVTTGCGVAPCYRFTATPVSGKPQANDAQCTSFIIDSAGTKTATGSTPDKCW